MGSRRIPFLLIGNIVPNLYKITQQGHWHTVTNRRAEYEWLLHLLSVLPEFLSSLALETHQRIDTVRIFFLWCFLLLLLLLLVCLF